MDSTFTIKTEGFSEVLADAEALDDLADEFCYELAMALRRILGLPAPGEELADEEVNYDGEVSDS